MERGLSCPGRTAVGTGSSKDSSALTVPVLGGSEGDGEGAVDCEVESPFSREGHSTTPVPLAFGIQKMETVPLSHGDVAAGNQRKVQESFCS